MTAAQDERILLEAARRAGFSGALLDRVPGAGDRSTARVAVDTKTNDGAIRLIDEMASGFADQPEVRELAATLERCAVVRVLESHSQPEAFGRTIHAWVKRHVRYSEERDEYFRAPLTTIEFAAGDCDDQTLLVVALARAGGLRARPLGMRDKAGDIVHVVGQLWHPDARGVERWHWAETTLDADYDEHPLEAAARLQSLRSDLR